jgi:hypothetical protein
MTPEEQAIAEQCEHLNATSCEVLSVELPGEVDEIVPAGIELIEVGEIVDITYDWAGDGKRYRHPFPSGSAAIYVTPHGGRGVVLLIGDFELNARGFVDNENPGREPPEEN